VKRCSESLAIDIGGTEQSSRTERIMPRICRQCADGSWICGPNPICPTSSLTWGYIQLDCKTYRVSLASKTVPPDRIADFEHTLEEYEVDVEITLVRDPFVAEDNSDPRHPHQELPNSLVIVPKSLVHS